MSLPVRPGARTVCIDTTPMSRPRSFSPRPNMSSLFTASMTVRRSPPW